MTRNNLEGIEKNRATSNIVRVWWTGFLAGRLIISSNRETRIASLYHVVRIVFAAYNYRPKRPGERGILDRTDSRSPVPVVVERFCRVAERSSNNVALSFLRSSRFIGRERTPPSLSLEGRRPRRPQQTRSRR